MRRFLGVLVFALLLAGCSSGEKSVSSDELAKQVKAAVEKELGISGADVSCPSKVEAEVGKTTTCTASKDGEKAELLVTITSVDGTDVKFDVESKDDASSTTTEPDTTAPDETTVPDETTTAASDPGSTPEVAPAELEAQLNAALEQQFGAPPDALTCPDPLEGTVGATTTCVLTDASETYDVLLTTKTVDGLDVNFDFKVADTPN